MDDKKEVVIVGAGPTGLMAACLLAQYGIQFRIFDKNLKRAEQSRALAIQARTLEILSTMGLVNEFVARGRIIKKIEPRPYGKKIHLNFNCLENETPYPYILILAQSETEEILEKKLNSYGIHVEREHELIGVVQNHDTVSVKIKNLKNNVDEVIVASYVLGADGAHSVIRNSLNLNFVGEPYPQHFWLADLSLDDTIPDDCLSVYVKSEGVLAFLPMHTSRTFRLVGQLKTSDRQAPSLSQISDIVTQMTGKKIHCSHPTWVTTFNLHHRLVDKMQVGRLFLLGDSAHIHSPVGGQGMNTGMQDAYNLCWKLNLVLKKKIRPAILESYQLERHPVGAYLLGKSDKMFQMVTSEAPFKKLCRRLFFTALWRILKIYPSAADNLIWFVSQLKIKYKKGDVFDVSAFHHPTAGERAPWFLLDVVGSNEKLDLFSLLDNKQHHVLIFSKMLKNEDYKAIMAMGKHEQVKIHIFAKDSFPGVVVPKSDTPFHVYNVKEAAIVFVRPDGYIAIRYESLAIKEFSEFLEAYFKVA